MTIPVAAKLNLALSMAVALGLIACGSAAADAPIYKCAQAGAVLYADFPCNGGAILDIHPGVADPAANARLQRAQAELDKGAARRRAEEELAAQRAEVERMRYDAAVPRNAPEPDMSYPDVAYGLVLGGYGRAPHRRPGPPHPTKRLEHRGFQSNASLGTRRVPDRNMANGNRPNGGG
jgi:hypothetical protein